MAYDTTYSLDTTVIVTLYEDLRGLHEIGCDSRVWSFSHWGIGDHPYRQWLDTARTVYQTDYNNWAVERLYFDRNRGLYRRDYSKNTLGNTHYSLSIRAVLLDPLSDVPVRDFPANATDFTLFQNFPNPFNPTTVVSYQLPAPSGVERSGARSVRLVVYDTLGRDVAMLVNEKKGPGRYQVRYDASGLSSGVYIYRLTAGKYVESRRMVLVR